MQTITNPTAIELSNEVRKTVSSNDFVNDTLNRKKELEQLRAYMERQTQKGEALGMQKGEAVGMEKMIIMALQSNAPTYVIEAMQKGAGITKSRLAELKKQAQMLPIV